MDCQIDLLYIRFLFPRGFKRISSLFAYTEPLSTYEFSLLSHGQIAQLHCMYAS
jgi:hypothetical protein